MKREIQTIKAYGCAMRHIMGYLEGSWRIFPAKSCSIDYIGLSEVVKNYVHSNLIVTRVTLKVEYVIFRSL